MWAGDSVLWSSKGGLWSDQLVSGVCFLLFKTRKTFTSRALNRRINGMIYAREPCKKTGNRRHLFFGSNTFSK